MPRALSRQIAAALAVAFLLAPPLATVGHADPTVHVVAPGETLSQIAQDAGVSVQAIMQANGLTSPDLIVAGQSLTIPAADPAASSDPPATPTEAAAAPPPTADAAPGGQTYTVQPGDTLWGIAHRFGISTDALMQANGLSDPNQIVAGSQLTIPGGGTNSAAAAPTTTPVPSAAPAGPASGAVLPPGSILVPYTIQPGETLAAVAARFGVSSDVVAQASGLQSQTAIRPGQVLQVPVPARQHTVQQGETLFGIARSEHVDLGVLMDANHIQNPRDLRAGTVLLVPSNLPAAAPKPGGSPAPASTPAPTAQPAAGPAPANGTPPHAAATPAPQRPKVVPTPPAWAPKDGLAGVALKYLGAPYVFGGASPAGFDCSGFVWFVARQAGKSVSRSLLAQYNAGQHPDRSALQPGDLVFFQNTYVPGLSHNGIYLGHNLFVNAGDEASGVTISDLTTSYWASHWFGATRLP